MKKRIISFILGICLSFACFYFTVEEAYAQKAAKTVEEDTKEENAEKTSKETPKKTKEPKVSEALKVESGVSKLKVVIKVPEGFSENIILWIENEKGEKQSYLLTKKQKYKANYQLETGYNYRVSLEMDKKYSYEAVKKEEFDFSESDVKKEYIAKVENVFSDYTDKQEDTVVSEKQTSLEEQRKEDEELKKEEEEKITAIQEKILLQFVQETYPFMNDNKNYEEVYEYIEKSEYTKDIYLEKIHSEEDGDYDKLTDYEKFVFQTCYVVPKNFFSWDELEKDDYEEAVLTAIDVLEYVEDPHKEEIVQTIAKTIKSIYQYSKEEGHMFDCYTLAQKAGYCNKERQLQLDKIEEVVLPSEEPEIVEIPEPDKDIIQKLAEKYGTNSETHTQTTGSPLEEGLKEIIRDNIISIIALIIILLVMAYFLFIKKEDRGSERG